MNKPLTPQEFAQAVKKAMNESGLTPILENASEKDRQIIVMLIANQFGANFPLDFFRLELTSAPTVADNPKTV